MSDVLSSWTDGARKQAILDFVARVVDEDGPDHVEAPDRIAVFDNDGTLWCERPLPVQLDFLVRRFAQMADQDPALRTRQPWRAAYGRDLGWIRSAVVKHYQGDQDDARVLIAAVTEAFAAVTVQDYQQRVSSFFEIAHHPTLQRPYRACGYRPMIELLRLLEANGFTSYIVSGGDRDFVRAIAGQVYGIGPERIIGSATGLDWRPEGDGGELAYTATMDLLDDGPQKPVRIWSRIGRRPIVAVGNSDGDLPMLAYAGSGAGPALRLLIDHDDGEREFDYVAGAERALREARAQNWDVVSMKQDWARVFSDRPAGDTGRSRSAAGGAGLL
jgi:phosphoglycolate phosphatase-like HAD superfamily hydrolase